MYRASALIGKIGIIIGFIPVGFLFIYAILSFALNDIGSSRSQQILFILFTAPFISVSILLIAVRGVRLLDQGDGKGLHYMLASGVLLAIPNLILEVSGMGSLFTAVLFPLFSAILLFLGWLIGVFSSRTTQESEMGNLPVAPWTNQIGRETSMSRPISIAWIVIVVLGLLFLYGIGRYLWNSAVATSKYGEYTIQPSASTGDTTQ